jgi:hypothetical protein
MKSKVIPDEALLASSHQPGYPPSNGRLGAKGWLSLSNDTSTPYFQVTFSEKKTIARVCLQGTNVTSLPNGGAWIKELYFSYSLDNINWTGYIHDGSKVIVG